MEKNSQKKGSDEQGSDLPELDVKQVLQLIDRDLKTARVLCLIPTVDEHVADEVICHLQARVKDQAEFDFTTEQLQSDASHAASLIDVLLSSSHLMQVFADVVLGFYQNLKNSQNANRSLGGTGDHGRGPIA